MASELKVLPFYLIRIGAIQATSEKLCHFEYLVEVVARWDEGCVRPFSYVGN